MKNEFAPPEPVEDEDYYIEEMYEYTVCIEVVVIGSGEENSEADVCADAIHKIRDGTIDGDASVVNSEYIKDVELCYDTDEPFDRHRWLNAKLTEMGVHADGSPIRSGEKLRPAAEKLLSDFR